ncbi:MAG: hypothetical protein RH980_05935, partial [Roseovarius confluentis]
IRTNFLGAIRTASKQDPNGPRMADHDHLVAGFDQVKAAPAHFALKFLTPDFALHPPAGPPHDRAFACRLARKQLRYPRGGRNRANDMGHAPKLTPPW